VVAGKEDSYFTEDSTKQMQILYLYITYNSVFYIKCKVVTYISYYLNFED